MFFDHLGYFAFPGIDAFRIIGRLAMPIFAFLVAEGCKYTRNKTTHLLIIFALGLVMMLATYLQDHQIVANIFLTFSISICIIYALEFFKNSVFTRDKRVEFIVLSIAMLIALSVLGIYLSQLVRFDYGLIGMFTPVAVMLTNAMGIDNPPKALKTLDNIWVKLVILAGMLVALTFSGHMRMEIQFFSLLALPLLALYNGKRGRYNLKYVFYAFYPLHVAVIWLAVNVP